MWINVPPRPVSSSGKLRISFKLSLTHTEWMGRSWLMSFKTNTKHVYKHFIDEDLQRVTTPKCAFKKNDRAWDNIQKQPGRRENIFKNWYEAQNRWKQEPALTVQIWASRFRKICALLDCNPARVDLFWTTKKRAQIHLNNNHRTEGFFSIQCRWYLPRVKQHWSCQKQTFTCDFDTTAALQYHLS